MNIKDLSSNRIVKKESMSFGLTMMGAGVVIVQMLRGAASSTPKKDKYIKTPYLLPRNKSYYPNKKIIISSIEDIII